MSNMWSSIIIIWISFSKLVSARDCNGGTYHCSSPKECCPQGCCYLYAPPSSNNTPKSPPPTDHVLNLFFINHWYFWCLVFAIVLALILFCSLWKKRRQLCGWNSPDLHSQSGSGSYSIPPQYSRCSSFHQPPPYTEVTSKPDLYPLVFSYTGDGKAGANYLMVQYFRNYIVRPVGSISGTSTVDSLSSSFICNGNAPPSYSRAQSPDLSISIRNYPMPRSASQACTLDNTNNSNSLRPNSLPNSNFHSTIITTPNMEAYNSDIDERINLENPQTFRRLMENYQAVGEINENMILLNNESDDVITIKKSTIKNAHFRYNNKYDNNNLTLNNNVNNSNSNTNNNQIGEIFSSCNSINVPADGYTNFNMLHQTLDACYSQQNQQQHQQQRHNEIVSRYESYMNSNNESIVSSLANLESPCSPPNPQSPTGRTEIRELLEQIRQFQNDPATAADDGAGDDDHHRPTETTSHNNIKASVEQQSYANGSTCTIEKIPRPSSLHGKRKFFCKTNRNTFIASANSRSLKSPIETLLRKGFISKSAPTTPNQPPYYNPDDSSPLLDENDEDQTN